jgi:hypothetical protein
MATKETLDAAWADKQSKEDLFAVRAICEDLYNNVVNAEAQIVASAKTGDKDVDDTIKAIQDAIKAFRSALESKSDFVRWRQP